MGADGRMSTGLEQGLAILERRAFVAGVLIVAVIGSAAIHAAGIAALMIGGLTGDGMFVGSTHIIDITSALMLLATLCSMVAVAMWIHRAHENLQIAGFPALEYSPGWAVGWYFIPIANFFMPFRAMRELWNASHGAVGGYSQSAPPLLWIWWLCWIFGYSGGFGEVYGTIDLLGVAFNIPSAIALFKIIETVTERQRSMNVAEAFA